MSNYHYFTPTHRIIIWSLIFLCLFPWNICVSLHSFSLLFAVFPLLLLSCSILFYNLLSCRSNIINLINFNLISQQKVKKMHFYFILFFVCAFGLFFGWLCWNLIVSFDFFQNLELIEDCLYFLVSFVQIIDWGVAFDKFFPYYASVCVFFASIEFLVIALRRFFWWMKSTAEAEYLKVQSCHLLWRCYLKHWSPLYWMHFTVKRNTVCLRSVQSEICSQPFIIQILHLLRLYGVLAMPKLNG